MSPSLTKRSSHISQASFGSRVAADNPQYGLLSAQTAASTSHNPNYPQVHVEPQSRLAYERVCKIERENLMSAASDGKGFCCHVTEAG